MPKMSWNVTGIEDAKAYHSVQVRRALLGSVRHNYWLVFRPAGEGRDLIKPNEKLYVQYLEQLTEKAHETFKAMLYVEHVLKGNIDDNQTFTWLQLKAHFENGVRGLQQFTDEVKK